MTAATERREAATADVAWVRGALAARIATAVDLTDALYAAEAMRLLNTIESHAPHVLGEVCAVIVHDLLHAVEGLAVAVIARSVQR